ncbi:MAG TPA: hypothetical protein VNR65_02600, partial [Geobacterales bacterium]|nr:hypothetical protein [Geobacterales bacterium]
MKTGFATLANKAADALMLGTLLPLLLKQVIMARDFAASAAGSVLHAVVRESAVVRFAGDSGDGMQLSGNQFTLATALAGNALATFPDFPAEIRAPQGSTFGVSAFQINFGSTSIETAGDEPDVLIAM